MKVQIPRRVAAAVLNSLAAGVVPRTGQEYIAIGRTKEIAALLSDLETVEDGGSAFRMITGRYGSGKSFLLQLLRSHALERGFAVADCDLSPERRLAGAKGQGLATYRELMRNLSCRAAPDGGALPVILSRWIASVQLDCARREGLSPSDPKLAQLTELAITDAISGFSGLVHGFDFAAAVGAFYRGLRDGDEELKNNALRWLRGEFPNKTEAKRALPVSSVITDETWYDFLKLMSSLMAVTGQKGLLIIIDEAVNLYKIVQTVAREANYEKLLNIFNDATQGRLSHMAFFFGGTPQLVEDTRRGLYSYEALRSRLRANRFAGDGVQDFAGPVLSLAPLTPEELLALLKRIVALHALRYDWTPPVSDEQLAAFVSDIASRMGADVLLTPREVVRDFTGLLNLLQQNPGESFESIAGTLEIRPADRTENGETGEFAEFTL
ncbi:MAG: ATP-binding protein [Eubacteriales bacterium]|nr:ATP-binding protein [Eubacteriales bacterium]